VIAPGVELRPLPERQEARTLLGVQPDALVVAYLGRLIPVKRPDRFVDMASALSKSIPHARFLVCGDGSLAEETRERALPLDGRIRFLGWRGDVETIYAACDVVVVSSDNEGMPVSLIEAALAARPTVTTAVGSAPEVVLDGVTGFVTECEPQALVERTKRLLGDTALRERMGRMAKERAEREFSGARLIEDTESLYEEVATELR
jgi:glycosyltransferase involved in cell wall biosynthesis